jgi:hypothetical protein
MKKTLAKAVIVLYGAGFIIAGIAAVIHGASAIVGAIILVIAGISLLQRKIWGVHVVLYLSLVVAAVGVMLLWMATSGGVSGRGTMMLAGLVPLVAAVLTIVIFTRRSVAEEFGLPEIRLLDKVDKPQVIAAIKTLLWIAAIVAVVLGACYLIAMHL